MWRSTYCSIPAPIAPLKRNVMGEPTAMPVAPPAGDTDMNAAPAEVPPPEPFMPDPVMLLPPPQATPSAAASSAADPPIHFVISSPSCPRVVPSQDTSRFSIIPASSCSRLWQWST